MPATWDYEESRTGYYHIYAYDGPLDEVMTAITLDLPQTEDNDHDVQAIVALLNLIEERLG